MKMNAVWRAERRVHASGAQAELAYPQQQAAWKTAAPMLSPDGPALASELQLFGNIPTDF